MDCRRLEHRLEALLDGLLTAAERDDCLAHVAACSRCGELMSLASPNAAAGLEPRDTGDLRGDVVRSDLVQAVLAHTSGPACGNAGEHLASALDDALEPADRMLVDLHLAGCTACRGLGRTLEQLRGDLPRLAQARPDPRLLGDVLAATLPAPARWRRWWAATWPRWVLRPRFASEAAFAATMALLLVLEAGGSPLQALSQRAVEVTRAATGSTLRASAAALEARVAASLDLVRRSAAARLVPRSRAFAATARQKASAAAHDADAQLATLWDRAASWWKSAEKAPAPRPAR